MSRPTLPAGRGLALVLFAASALPACNPEIGQYKPRVRDYKPPVTYPQEAERPNEGSLWTATQVGNYLVTDKRALSVGDVVTIRIEEVTDATREATTRTGRSSSLSNSITDVLALLKYLQPELSAAELLGGASKSDFEGGGKTTSKDVVTARVTATVRQVLPNGNMFVEGWKAIQLNQEQQQLYISGVLRPEDIADDNTVASTRLAEAEIGIGGVGVVSDVQSPGILTRTLNKYSPF